VPWAVFSRGALPVSGFFFFFFLLVLFDEPGIHWIHASTSMLAAFTEPEI